MELLSMLPKEIAAPVRGCGVPWEKLQEIRLRAGRGLCIRTGEKEQMLGRTGEFVTRETQAYPVTEALLKTTVELLTGYSLYAFEEEIRQGFFTVAGGHRVGVAGHAVFENNVVTRLGKISYINLRIAHEIKGCAKELFDVLYGDGRLYHTLLFSPPGCGKTTYLRDLIRFLSEQGVTVGVADERLELGAVKNGQAQFDLGVHTDVLDGCPKAAAMQMLLRSMNPRVLAADELGAPEDVTAVRMAAGSGCTVLASAHAEELSEIRENPLLGILWEERRFSRYVRLEKRREGFGGFTVFDKNGQEICRK